MIKFRGKVLTVEDEMRDIPDKDKDGNRLPTKTSHRCISITMLVKDGSRSVPLVVKGFDSPSSFVCPKEGEEWETPTIRAFDARFKSVPECSI